MKRSFGRFWKPQFENALRSHGEVLSSVQDVLDGLQRNVHGVLWRFNKHALKDDWRYLKRFRTPLDMEPQRARRQVTLEEEKEWMLSDALEVYVLKNCAPQLRGALSQVRHLSDV